MPLHFTCSLKQFYYNTQNLQYFKNLIRVPTLPDVSCCCFLLCLNLEIAEGVRELQVFFK